MKLTFENEIGSIFFGENEIFKITALSGIYLPSKTYGTINFAGYDGQLTYQSNSNARIITLGVDILSKNIRTHLEKAMRVLNKPGTLILDYGYKVRKIICNQVTFSLSERSATHAVFAVQFVCDNPYFTDLSPVKYGIHGSVGLITNPITLPCVLSTSDTKRKIINSGDEPVYPVITISVKQKGIAAEIFNSGYKFKNNTTGKELYLQYISQAGEKIVIDIKRRTTLSDINGNLLSYIHADTVLEDFYLAPGENDIEAIDLGNGDVSRMSMEFENYYIEAVY
ncbi:MAG: phage tail family protein [Oscillospiraceae bacterium]|nr:phage tail family protein [Oscillospiraceae bacterium]